MKKIILIIGIIVCSFAAMSQNNGYVSKVTDYIILQGDTIRLDTSSLSDGQVIKRVNGVWTNGTGAAGSAAVDSLVWDSVSNSVGWYISGSIAGYAEITGFVNIEDSTTVYVTPTQLENAVTNQQIAGYYISLPSSGTVAGRIATPTYLPDGWTLTVGSSSVDLNIEHNLGRRVFGVTVVSVDGTEEQLLSDSAGHNGWVSTDTNNLLIKSLATIGKPIKIYIIFL